MYNIKGTLSGSGRIGGRLSGSGSISAALTTPHLVYPGIYQGPTTVTPGHADQVLSTSNLLLTSNITVLKIPEPEFVEEIYDSGDTKLSATSFATWTPSIRYYNSSGALTYTPSISYGIYPVLVASTFASSTADIPR